MSCSVSGLVAGPKCMYLFVASFAGGRERERQAAAVGFESMSETERLLLVVSERGKANARAQAGSYTKRTT